MNGTITARFLGRVGSFPIDIAFEAPSEGLTAVVGPSGSGKTTLLRCLAGLERLPGTLRINDDVWQDDGRFVAAEHRRVGFVFQGDNLLPHLSVRDNLGFAARRAGAGPFDLSDVVARTGIAPILDRMPAGLSGGEGRRAAIARALMSQPRMLLMDEPLAGLDQRARAELVEAFVPLLASMSLPVFYVTHEPAEVEQLAGWLIRLENGTVATAKRE